MARQDELAWIRSQELRLLDPAVRRDAAAAVRALLHPDFLEFGASGRVWDRASVVLVTYRVGARDAAGSGSLRSSLWVRDGPSWRIRFHEGTPAG